MASLQAPTPAPPPDLHLHLVVDGDDDLMEENQGAGSRRPSTASLSRFRSCPHLASVMNASQDSPGSDMAPLTDQEGNIIHMTPNSRNSLQVDAPKPDPGGIRSAAATPTPPSTPGSRRRDLMSASFSSKPQSNGASPTSTPKLARRRRMDNPGRAYSTDSEGRIGGDTDSLPGGFVLGGHSNDQLHRRCHELVHRDTESSCAAQHSFDDYPDTSFDEDGLQSDTDGASSMHVVRRQGLSHTRQQFRPGSGDDSVGKCSRWLQSLRLTNSDKIKSRSHIQLPPV